MTSPLAYRPRSRPLQLASPSASVAYLASLALVCFLFSDPLLLTAATVAAVVAGWAAGVGSAVRFALKIGLLLAGLLVLVNGLVVSRGGTVLLRLGDVPLLGRIDVTLEALFAGAVIGLRALAVMVVAAVYSAAVDPDRVLRALRPWLARSAMTAGLASRLFPLAVDDARRLGEAARLRGPGAAAVGRGPMARRLLAGSLDRAVDVAAGLELRGYALPAGGAGRRPRSASGGPRSRFDRRFFIAALAIAMAGIVATVAGLGGYDAYRDTAPDISPESLALAVGLAAVGLVPMRFSRPRLRTPKVGGPVEIGRAGVERAEGGRA